MNQQNGQEKPLPSIELSLKYIAWDLKQLKEAVIDYNNNFKTYLGMSRTRSSNDTPPF